MVTLASIPAKQHWHKDVQKKDDDDCCPHDDTDIGYVGAEVNG